MKQPTRLKILQRIGDELVQARQWATMKDFDRAANFTARATALIELLEIHDCGSSGGYDKGQSQTDRYSLFTRWVWLFRRHGNRPHYKCSTCSYEELEAFYGDGQ